MNTFEHLQYLIWLLYYMWDDTINTNLHLRTKHNSFHTNLMFLCDLYFNLLLELPVAPITYELTWNSRAVYKLNSLSYYNFSSYYIQIKYIVIVISEFKSH